MQLTAVAPRPEASELIEVNFIGLDPEIIDPIDTYEKPDDRLPLMVFGPLSLLAAGPIIEIDGLRIPLPRPAGLALEKLVRTAPATRAIATRHWFRCD